MRTFIPELKKRGLKIANFYGGLVPAARRESQTPGVGVGEIGQVAWVGVEPCMGRIPNPKGKGQAVNKQRNNISQKGVDSPVNV